MRGAQHHFPPVQQISLLAHIVVLQEEREQRDKDNASCDSSIAALQTLLQAAKAAHPAKLFASDLNYVKIS